MYQLYYTIQTIIIQYGAVVYQNCDNVKNLTADKGDEVTLYAKWDIQTYTITYVTNGGVISGQSTKYTVYDEYINVPNAVYPTYSEYNHFLGWYENDACTIPYKGDLKSNPRNITLYAKWDVCDVFGSMDETPLIIKGTNPLITSDQRIIVDWSKETDTNLANHLDRDVDGTERYDCLDIQNTVKEIIFIGSQNKVYTNLKIRLCDFNRGQQITIKLDKFCFVAPSTSAIETHNNDGIEITIEFIDFCSIETVVGGGCTVDVPQNDLIVVGTGELNISAGNSSNSRVDGSVGIKAKNVTIDASGLITIKGGNGSDGMCSGDNGSNGGVGIKSDTFNVSGSVVLNIFGGNGGNGIDGEKGYAGTPGRKGNNESQTKHPVYGYNGHPGGDGGVGQDGGAGGNGAAAIVLIYTPVINNNGIITFTSGNGGCGGGAGDGGDGGRGGDGGDDDKWSFIGIGDMSGGSGGEGGAGGEPGKKGVGGLSEASVIVNGVGVQIVDGVTIQNNGTKGDDGGAGNKGIDGARGNHGNGGGLGTS